MNKVTRLAACTTLAALVLTASLALAASKPAPVATPITNGTGISVLKFGSPSTNATCTLGNTNAPTTIIDYVFPPNDRYYTFVDPSACSACNSGPVQALAAHFYLNFRTTCNQVMSVGVYGVTGDAACYFPDETHEICSPVNVTVTPPAPGNYNINVALPAGCCFTGPAFLKVEFVNAAVGCGSNGANYPRLITDSDCTGPCLSWNIWPGGGPDDLCVDIGFPGRPVMNLDVDCCAVTPTQKHSWGSVKSIYR